VRLFPAINPWLQRFAMRWYPGRERRDRSYRVFPSARTVRFNEMEYELPVAAGVECYREVLEVVRRQRLPVCFPLEFRRVKGDSLWLSPFHERDSVSISLHQHWQEDYEPLFRVVEPVFWKYEGRPHWGKLHTLTASRLQHLYPKWREFAELRKQLDPGGKFLNGCLRKLVLEN
jgi:FAD/FMN-containing dehydrogenase